MRISKDKYYLNIAKSVSARSTCLKRHYGAVIVNNDEIISTGYNGAPRGEENCCDKDFCPRINKPHNSGDYSDCPAVHAEMNAIISASRKEMLNGTLYLCGVDPERNEEVGGATPCPICMKLIKNSGIIKIVNNKEIIDL